MKYDVDEEREILDEKMKVGKWLDRQFEKGLAKGTLKLEEVEFINKIFTKMTSSKYDDFWYDHAHEKAKEVIFDVFNECEDEIEYELIQRLEEA